MDMQLRGKLSAMLPFSEACERNKGPILEILRAACADAGLVLEIGSGTGQHAVYFAGQLPHLTWQPSDVPENLPDLAARVRLEGGGNIRAPLSLDVRDQPWPIQTVHAVYSANTLHIMDESSVQSFFRGVGSVLPVGGILCVYGPFRYGGRYTSESNASFDRYLRTRDPASGIRDAEWVDALATQQGLRLEADHPMPAHNQMRIWRRGG
jgi:cyclopropane fatty-acyl-phospholipid synthase-like methyltransferase